MSTLTNGQTGEVKTLAQLLLPGHNRETSLPDDPVKAALSLAAQYSSEQLDRLITVLQGIRSLITSPAETKPSNTSEPKRTRLSDEERTRIRDLHGQGRTIAEIAAETGRNYVTVKRAIHEEH